MEGSLAETQDENTRLNEELLQKSESFEQERKSLQTKYEAKVVENTKLQQSLKELRNMCLGFGSRCVQRLKKVFNSLGASAEKFTPSAENISSTFEHIEGEVEALDKVIGGHGDFCALLASHDSSSISESWLYAREDCQ
jgi:chromosome segregation ATPase